jgi:hypothetical protein
MNGSDHISLKEFWDELESFKMHEIIDWEEFAQKNDGKNKKPLGLEEEEEVGDKPAQIIMQKPHQSVV